MKQYVILLFSAILAVGCGNPKASSVANEGVSEQKTEADGNSAQAAEGKEDPQAYDLEAIAKAIEGCESLESFSFGLAAVEKNGKVGFIDKMGRTVIPFEYDTPTQEFTDGVVALSKGDDNVFLDNKGNELFRSSSFGRFHDGLATSRQGDLIGFVDKTGKMVIPAKYDYTGDFSDGLCWVTSPQSGSLIGFIDTTGKLVVPFQYEWPSERQPADFHEGLCPVMVDPDHEYFGYIDTTGKRAFPGIYFGDVDFSEGLACVSEIIKTDGENIVKIGYIDTTGKMVINLPEDNGGPFHGGVAPVRTPGGAIYFIDKTGKQVFELDKRYKTVEHYGEGTWIVWDGENMGYIDNTGKTIVPCRYYAYKPFSEGLAAVRESKDGRWGFVDKKGHTTFEFTR